MHHLLRSKTLTVLLCFLFSGTMSAQVADSSQQKIAASPVSPSTTKVAIADSNANLKTPTIPPLSTTTSYTPISTVRSVHIDEYSSKVASIPSSIPLQYNAKVRSLINVYTEQRRNVSERILAYSEVYFPIFENILAQYGIPTELKYLAICESALNTHAVSRSGAVGLWQLMGPTAKDLHLTINDQIDERRDPYKATHAAARYLKKLYNKYGDWQLAMAAYNCGPGAMDNVIKRSGGIYDFWLLHDYLPQETRSYVPSYIGATYLMNYYFDHYLRPVELEFPHAFAGSDTVLVRGPIHFAAITQYINVKEAELRFLNPAYKQDALPKSNYPMSLRLPVTEIGAFKQKLPQIYNYSKLLHDAANGNEIAEITNWSDYGEMPGSADADMLADGYEVKTIKKKTTVKTNKTQYYTVKKGDVLSKIADRYNCSIGDLKRWNKLKSSKIEHGNKLKIVKATTTTKYVPVRVVVPSSDFSETANIPTPAAATNSNNSGDIDKLIGISLYDEHSATISPNNATTPNLQPKKEIITKTYTVRKGDNLIDIAQKLDCSVSDLKRWNKLKSSKIDVKDQLKYQKTVWTKPKAVETAAATTPTTLPTPKNTPTKVNINDLAELGSINLYDNNIIITDDATVVSEQLSRYGDLEADDADFVKTSQKFYTVRKGDALSEIATQNKCTVADLKRWNKLKSNVITPGQQLKIAPDATTLSDETTLEKAAAAAEEVVEDVVSPAAQQTVSGIGNYHQIDWDKLGISSDNKPTTTVEPITFDLRAEENTTKTPTEPATKTITETVTETYTVKKGDVLGEIAEKFKCSVKDLQRWNSIKGTTIEHGDKLKIVRKIKKTIPADKDKPTTTSSSTKDDNIPSPIVVDIDDIETLGGINLYDEGIVIGENIDNSSATALAARTNENSTDQPKATAKPATAKPKLTSYKVKKGDTLWDIVQKFPANTVESLCQLNKLNKKSALQPGSTVKVKTK